MKVCQNEQSLFVRRRNAVLAFTLFISFVGVFVMSGPAWSMELESPSSVMDVDSKKLSIISDSTSVQGKTDSCLPLLKSVSHFRSPSSAMDRNRQNAGKKAATLGFVFGVRFALGPKEVRKSRSRSGAVKFDIWQPRDEGGVQAMAVAQYRRCKNDQALKALSDWRWAR